MSIRHNKSLNTLLNSLVKYISVRYSPKTLAIEGDCTFILLIFLIIGLCNSSAYSGVWSKTCRTEALAMQANPKGCLFEIFPFLIPLPDVFYPKIYRTYKQVRVILWIFSTIKCFITQYFIWSCSSS